MRHSLIAAMLLMAIFPATARPLPPRPPSAAKTRVAIRHLRIATPLSMEGYSRDRFPHWTNQAAAIRASACSSGTASM
jgi:hypothetical protein